MFARTGRDPECAPHDGRGCVLDALSCSSCGRRLALFSYVLRDAPCKEKLQVRVTGLGPDGAATTPAKSKAKKLKC